MKLCNDVHILIFRLPIAFRFKNDFWAWSNRRFSTKRVIPCYSTWKDACEPPQKPRKNEKVGKMNHPNVYIMLVGIYVFQFFFSALRALREAKVVPYATVVDNTLLKHVFRAVRFPARAWHHVLM